MESTRSAPKPSGECRSWGWKGANCVVASSTSTIPGTFGCLQAALTIATAMPALIALGYSVACEVFHEPSAFLPIRQPAGALGLSNFFNYSVSSLPILTDISLVGFLVAPPKVQCWRWCAWTFGSACNLLTCSVIQIEGAASQACLDIRSGCSVQLAMP